MSFRSAALLPDYSGLKLGTMDYGSALQGVSQYYLVGNYLFGEESQHSVGLQVHNKDRGNLISETSLKGSYRKEIQLNEESKLSLGINAGFYQIFLKSSPTTQGASDMTLDMDWSVAYAYDNWVFSGYFGNYKPPSVKLIQEEIIYYRYYGVYGGRKIEFPLQQLEGMAEANAYLQNDQIYWRASYSQEFIKNVYAGTSANQESLGFYGGVKEIDMKSLYLDIHFGYSFPTFSTLVNTYTPLQLQLVVRGL